MRRVLLDTDVLAALRRPTPDPAVARWIATVPPEQLWLHPVVLAEIRIGIETGRAHGQADAVVARERWLERLVAVGQVAPFGAPEADLWGRMLCSPVLRAAPSLSRDMMIAASAIVGDFAVATIGGTGLRLINRHFPLPALIDPSTVAEVVLIEAPPAPVLAPVEATA